jgi:hypothetical protein
VGKSGFARRGHLIDSGKHEIPIAAGSFRFNWRRNELAGANLRGSVSSIKKFSSLEMLNRYITRKRFWARLALAVIHARQS